MWRKVAGIFAEAFEFCKYRRIVGLCKNFCYLFSNSLFKGDQSELKSLMNLTPAWLRPRLAAYGDIFARSKFWAARDLELLKNEYIT
jgi:hypothetical protein